VNTKTIAKKTTTQSFVTSVATHYGKVLDFMTKKTLDSQKNTSLQKQSYTQWKCPENALQRQP